MVKAKRAVTRANQQACAVTRARKPVRRPRKTAVLKPPSPRRYVYTEELLANGRHRYEHTDEPVVSIAADFGCDKTTFQRMANREHWVRYVAPPRGLPHAAQILAQVEKLEAGERQDAPSQATPTVTLPLAGGGNGAADETPPPADVVARFRRAVLNELGAVEAMRDQLQRTPQRPRDALETARTLTILTEALHRLERLQGGAPQPGYDDDDFPTDIDAFRDELAQKIESFLASRADAGDAE